MKKYDQQTGKRAGIAAILESFTLAVRRRESRLRQCSPLGDFTSRGQSETLPTNKKGLLI